MADGAIGYPGGLERRDYTPGASPAGTFPALPSALRRISWGGVFAGLIVSIMVSLVLALLGMAIGLGTVNPAEESNPFSGLGIGAAIWWVVSSLIALFCGGWVAARMAGNPKGFDGAIHGVLAWGLATLFTFYLLGTTIGRLVGGVSSMVGQGLSMAGSGAQAIAPELANVVEDAMRQQGITLGDIQQEATDLINQAAAPGAGGGAGNATGQGSQGAAAAAMANPQQAISKLKSAIGRMAQGDGSSLQAGKNEAVDLIASNTGKSRAEAQQIVSRWESTLQQAGQKLDQAKQQAGQKARQWGETAAAGMSKASLWTFIALLLGGISAALGGRFGAPKDVQTATVKTSDRT